MQEQRIKEKIKERYSRIALTGTETCTPTIEVDYNKSNSSCCTSSASSTSIGYTDKELESIPKSAILGVGCGAPLHYADAREGETVVDLGSRAGIDIFVC